MSSPPVPLKAWLMLGLLSLLWGGSFLFIGLAVREVPPLTVVWIRISIGAAALGMALWLTNEPLPRAQAAWRDMAVIAVLLCALPFCLIVWAQTHITAGLASILNATTPLWGAVAAHFLTRDDNLTPMRAAALGAGFLGVVVLMGWPQGAATLAILACLGAALSYGLAGVYARRLRRHGLKPLVAATMQLGLAATILLPVMLVVDRPWLLPVPSRTAALSLLALALLSTGLAYLVYFRIVALAGMSNALLVTFLVPPSAILLAWLGLGEALMLRQLLGMLLIGGGLVLLDGRWRRRRS